MPDNAQHVRRTALTDPTTVAKHTTSENVDWLLSLAADCRSRAAAADNSGMTHVVVVLAELADRYNEVACQLNNTR